MPTGARLDNLTTGHDGYPPTPFVSSSPNVFIKGKGVIRVGDSATDHSKPNFPPHPVVSAGGSGTVKINGLPLSRTGDPTSCGDHIASTGTHVFVGG